LLLILEVCKEYCFIPDIPDTTIRQFANKKEMYPIGTIGAAVKLVKWVRLHYILHIKDRDSENDNATVCIYTTIRQFANKKEIYPIGTIGAAIKLVKWVGLHYILHIKDRVFENNNATACICILLIPNFQ